MFVRLTTEEHDVIQRAIKHQTTGVVGGAAVSVAAFASEAAVRAAHSILGEDK